MSTVTLLVELVRAIVAHFRRTPELPSFTSNIDDTEAKWSQEQLDEWDRAFNESAGFLPAFSRLEAERLKGLSDLQAESEQRRREILKRGYAAQQLHYIVKADAERYLFRSPGEPILADDSFVHYEREGPIDAPWNLMASPSPFVRNEIEVARYNELLRAKGIDPDRRQP